MAMLADVCTITMGLAPPGVSYNDRGEGLPLVAGAGDFGAGRLVPTKFTTQPSKVSVAGDIILSIRASIGAKVWADGEYCLGRGVVGLRPGPSLDPAFLWHWLTYSERSLAAKGRGATFVQVNRTDIGEMSIDLPPVGEQRRIAAILDQADALRVKRRQVLAHLDTLTQSIFHDMFRIGSCDVTAFEVVCKRVTVGVVIKPASHYVEIGVPALRTLNVRPGRLDLEELVYFSEESNNGPLRKSQLRSGDLVIARTGKPGTTSIAPPQLDGANAIDLIIATPDCNRALPSYLQAFLNSQLGRRMVAGEQRGQIQQHFNVGSLKRAQIPVPTLNLQREFSARAQHIDVERAAVQRTLDAGDALFASLQSRAFRREL